MRSFRAIGALFAAATLLVTAACGGGPSGGAQPSGSGAVWNEPFVFLSTQFNTVTESEAVRSQVIAGFNTAKVDFVGSEVGPWTDRITAEVKSGKGQVGVVGGQHGDFGALAN